MYPIKILIMSQKTYIIAKDDENLRINAEIDKHLKDFMEASDPLLIASTAERLKPYYKRLVIEDEICLSSEILSPLEIVAEQGMLTHLNVLLNRTRPSSTKERLREKVAPEALYSHESAAFFRAIRHGHTSIVSRLLLEPKVSNDLLDRKIRPKHKSTLSEFFSREEYYLDTLQRAKNYPIEYNRIFPKGNVALALAASLPQADIFNLLLTIEPLRLQLSDSALVCFAAATIELDGSMRPEVNHDIVLQLLENKQVYTYAQAREFDFGGLVTLFDTRTLSEPSEIEEDMTLTSSGKVESIAFRMEVDKLRRESESKSPTEISDERVLSGSPRKGRV